MDHQKSTPDTPPWFDVTVPVSEHITVFPGTPAAEVRLVMSRDGGDQANLSELRLSTHTGTHIDAPLHFIDGAPAVDELDLDVLNGPARVVGIPGVHRIGPDQLSPHEPGRGDRILLRTRNSDTAWYRHEFDPEYAHLTADGARLLVERGVAAVGIDYLSIGGEEIDNEETHQILLGAGVGVIEGLDLGAIEPGSYELRCLPLRVAGADGAPARALLRPAAQA